MILQWYKKNQKLALKITGANFLLMALVLLFWSQPKAGMSENEKAAANLARMEGSVKGKPTAKASQGANLMKKHAQKQKEQLRITLILMSLAGAGFLAYGFLKKE